MAIKFKNKDNMVIGVIADTHGLLPPTSIKILKGVDLIIHAGDVGKTEVLNKLRGIAPVVAVRGNMDVTGDLAELPETEVVEIGSVLFYVTHDFHKLDFKPEQAGFGAVISGHLHYPSVAEKKGVLFLNPGSATQPRRNYPASLALLYVQVNSIKARIVEI